MLSVDHVYKYYGSQCAVSDLTFAIPKGACVGFLGLNGAGKTTTLRMLSGLAMPSRGRIVIDGCDAVEDPEALRTRVGYLPDRPPLYPEMSVSEYLRFAAELRGLRGPSVTPATEHATTVCGLDRVRARRLGALSHGYRQRVGIAQAIVHRPSLLVLDEPLQGLDPVQTAEMRDVIARLRGEHTVLLSTHMLGEIQQTCDRILVLHEGRVAMEGTEAELGARAANAKRVVVLVRGEEGALRGALAGLEDLRDLQVDLERPEGLLRAHMLLPEALWPEVSRRVVTAGLQLFQIGPQRSDLEGLFEALTSEVQPSTAEALS